MNNLENFAKLFELNGGQVLVYKDLDMNTGRATIVHIYKTEGPIVQGISSFKNEDTRNQCFERFDLDMAIKFVNETSK